MVHQKEHVPTRRGYVLFKRDFSMDVAEVVRLEWNVDDSLSRLARMRRCHRADKVHPLDSVRLGSVDGDRGSIQDLLRRALNKGAWASEKIRRMKDFQS
jgi:hypothetical protein